MSVRWICTYVCTVEIKHASEVDNKKNAALSGGIFFQSTSLFSTTFWAYLSIAHWIHYLLWEVHTLCFLWHKHWWNLWFCFAGFSKSRSSSDFSWSSRCCLHLNNFLNLLLRLTFRQWPLQAGSVSDLKRWIISHLASNAACWVYNIHPSSIHC